MSVVESVTQVVTAVGGLGGVAAVISAIRGSDKDQDSDKPRTPANESHVVVTVAAPHRTNHVRWCLVAAVCACVSASALVIMVGATSLALDRLPIQLMEWSVVAFAVFAIAIACYVLNHGIREKGLALGLYAGAGLVGGFGSLAATLIACTG